MALIEHTLFGKVDKVKTAIERIKAYDPIANGYMDEPYYAAYSGAKDSDTLRILFELSGVKYDLVHNHTTVDAPETVRYIRSIPGIQIEYPNITMWRLIEKKLMPPTRRMRYCCSEFKERGGQGRFVATGVRWAESTKRKNRNSLEVVTANAKNKIILNADNTEDRRLFENCIIKGRKTLNPIIDWSDDDVWEFLEHYDCKSNPLYQDGYKRVGCIGCPNAGGRGMLKAFERYPKYKQNYIRAFDRMLQARFAAGKPTDWQTGQDVFDWWVSDTPKRYEDELQMTLWE